MRSNTMSDMYGINGKVFVEPLRGSGVLVVSYLGLRSQRSLTPGYAV